MEQQAAYTVLARRFRPQTFDDVVGQEQIAQALRNSIRSGRVAHAYLFTGARGVGKTSSARIFAKALNCPNAVDAVPCNACEICRGISGGSDVDVLEIDGASNRGIDDIRQLRSNVNVKSMRSPFKVYIIDEVHMLTKEAFNALLKTLEEPPPNVKFIFCTTEPNKVPDTILSRCQRFDFGVIPASQIGQRLAEIATAEGIRVDDDAIALVARRAAGSMRDSQSLFDQLLAFGSEHISVADVHRLLGTAPDDRLFELFEAMIAENRSLVLEQLDRALAEGCQLGSLTDQLVSFFRDLLVTGAGAESVSLLSLSDSQRPVISGFAGRLGLRRISASLQILADCRSRMQRTTYGRPLLELALIRITLLGELNEISALLEQGNSPAPPAAQTRSAQPLQRQAAVPFVAGRLEIDSKKNDRIEARPEPAPAPEVPQNPKPHLTLQEVTTGPGWDQVLAQLPESHAGHLKKSTERAISGPNGLAVLFGANYFLSKSYCERPDAIARLASAVSELCGGAITVQVKALATPAPTQSSTNSNPKSTSGRRANSTTQNDPFVQQALGVFGGSVAEVREQLAGGLTTHDPA